MNTLVVYFSRTGNTKKVAEKIAKELGSDVEEIKEEKERKGFLGYMRSGREATLKSKPKIDEPVRKVKEYDVIIIGTPVWGWTMSSPVRSYIYKVRDDFKGVAFFCTMGGSGGKAAFKSMEDAASMVPKATLELMQKEVMADAFDKKVKDFADKLISIK